MKLFKYKNTYSFKIIILILIIILVLVYYNKKNNRPLGNEEDNESIEIEESNPDYNQEEIIINDVDGNNTNYEFTYNDESFKAVYTLDNWKIYNSYKIKNMDDMKKICQALIDIHPIHGRDMISYRTADDMVYEWLQHNLAYEILPENNEWRNNAKDVDFDPNDQWKNLKEIYEDRTDRPLDISEILNRDIKI